MTSGVAETKGANLLGAIGVAKTSFGAGVVERAIAQSLEPTLGPRAESRLVSLTWYPAPLYAAFLQALVDAAPVRGQQVMERLGHDIASRDFTGPYSIIAKVFSPTMLVSWGPKAFGRYYRGGTVRVVTIGPGHSETHFEGWMGFNTALWETVRGGIRGAISACGKPVTVTAKSGREGDMVFDITWKP